MEDLQSPAVKSSRKAPAKDSGRQAILTRYHGPTNHRGTRISATAQAGRISVSYDYALNSGDNHAAAAKHLAEQFGWNDFDGEWIGGQLPNQDYAWTWRALSA